MEVKILNCSIPCPNYANKLWTTKTLIVLSIDCHRCNNMCPLAFAFIFSLQIEYPTLVAVINTQKTKRIEILIFVPACSKTLFHQLNWRTRRMGHYFFILRTRQLDIRVIFSLKHDSRQTWTVTMYFWIIYQCGASTSYTFGRST